ncbi:MAG: SMP-30/gluconolactonase/LRE family protein [Verrucomicrobiota bacterium]
MRPLITLALSLLLTTLASAQTTPRQKESYPIHPDATRLPGVPQGTVTKHTFTDSQLFPGTERDYYVYVPAQYQPGADKPACLMVFQDGHRFVSETGPSKIPIVFDNLIHKGDMPVTIGVFVDPGVLPPPEGRADDAQPRLNRSFEYDTFDDRYASFLIYELLPEIDAQYTISADPNDRAICGASSGAIAAFNVAWFRPDQFRRVYSIVGTFVGLRGGNEYPVLVRKTEPKPLRIFLQDGSNDLDIYCGDWFVANQDMLSALQYNGYEVDHLWGEGYHGAKHGGAIMPDVLRWLWKDYPKPVTTHLDQRGERFADIILEDEPWELVSHGHGFTEGPAVAPDGTLYFSDLDTREIFKITPDGEKSVFWKGDPPARMPTNPNQKPPFAANGLAFGPDGKNLYACMPATNQVGAFDTHTGELTTVVKDVRPNDIVVAHDGTLYFTEPGKRAVWMKRPGEEAVIAADDYSGTNGVALSPDQTLLYAADFQGRYVWSAQIQPDGSLAHNQPFFHLHLPPASVSTRSHADGMAVSTEGWLLVATIMGIQVCDAPGRVNMILPPPPGSLHAANITFDPSDPTLLYATCHDKVFKRRLNISGAFPWRNPVSPPKPKL